METRTEPQIDADDELGSLPVRPQPFGCSNPRLNQRGLGKVIHTHSAGRKTKTISPQRHRGHRIQTAFTKSLLELSQLLELLGLVPRVSTGQNLQHQQNLVNRKIAILVLPFANWPKLCDLCVSVVKIVLVFRPSEMRLYGQSHSSQRPCSPKLSTTRCSRRIPTSSAHRIGTVKSPLRRAQRLPVSSLPRCSGQARGPCGVCPAGLQR